MRQSRLPKQIETLVEHLRKRDEGSLSLTEVAAVTEILIRTMDGFFRSVDLKIYEEVQNLSDYISNARKEIAALQPENLENSRIPRAGKELDAIVKATETATNTIMEAAEEIMAADTSEAETYQATVNDAVMRIFEACSFQDITGQRISKVVETLTYIERRAKELKSLLDVEAHHYQENEAPLSEDQELLRGPALEGEGIDQNEVDALMQHEAAPVEDNVVTPLKSATKPAAKVAPSAAKAGVNGKAAARPKSEGKKVEKLELAADKEGRTTQDDIDALFG